jgi:endonuclease/exonuclease/phosphatase family metal-dependent hydrolase
VVLRIVTYNIRGGRGCDGVQDYQRINKFLEEQEIDIALLQEVDMRGPKRAESKDILNLSGARFPFFVAAPAVKTPYGWFGNAILSRFPVLGHEVVDISIPKREPRNIIDAVIQTPQGLLRVLNTHKGLKRRERHRQMEKLNTLLKRESDLPLFLAGDINEWHTGARVMKTINRLLHPVGVGATFPTICAMFHLDRVWCRPARLIKDARILKTRETKVYSDHFPVLAELYLEKA